MNDKEIRQRKYEQQKEGKESQSRRDWDEVDEMKV